MKNHLIGYISLIAVIAMLLFATGSVTMVLAEGESRVEITNLSDGDVISELTILTGTIEFSDFLKYEIFLKSGDSLVWVGNSHSAVVNGNLVRLDPRVFVSGRYQLLIRQVNRDSNYTDTPGPTITIDNPNGTPLSYYPEVEPSFLYPSKEFAIVRVRNCTGEDFNFDYSSPDAFLSSGDDVLPGKVSEDSICTFRDLALIPGEYRGTGQGGGQDKGVPIQMVVDEWKVYHLIYSGPVAGGDQVIAQEVPADDMQADGSSKVISPTATPKRAEAKVLPPTSVPAIDSKTESILPTTGDETERNIFPIGLTLLVILVLGGGGVVAVRKRQYTEHNEAE